MTITTSRWTKVVLTLAAVALLAPAATWADSETGSFDRTLKVTGPVDLDLRSPYGNITVTTGSGNEVRVHATIKAKSKWRDRYSAEEKVRLIEQNPPITQTGNRIRIGYLDDEDLEKRVRINYEIVVPAATELRVRTGYGDVSVSGINRPAEIRSGYGNIELAAPAGAVAVSTGYGDIRVEGSPTEDWRLKTGYGDVRLLLPQDAAFALDFRTGYGSVRTDHPMTIKGSFSNSHVQGTVRGGGPEIRVRTGYGSVRVE